MIDCRKTIAVVCDKCGHRWNYGGLMVFATCPSCRRLNKVREITGGKQDGV